MQRVLTNSEYPEYLHSQYYSFTVHNFWLQFGLPQLTTRTMIFWDRWFYMTYHAWKMLLNSMSSNPDIFTENKAITSLLNHIS